MKDPLRVLLVEDEALILMQLESLVEEAGHHVVGTAMRSSEAVEIARAANPELALVDLHLVDGDSGLDVAQALKEMGNVMVVFVTANPLRLGSDFAGGAGVITKPFTRSVMMQAMSYLEECVRHPPPVSAVPLGISMATEYLSS